MNLSLSIDDELLKSAEEVARAMNTSVNSLIIEYLQKLVEHDEWMSLMNKNSINMAERSWNRDELHER